MTPFHTTDYAKQQDPKHVKFVELMFSAKSEVSKDMSFDERLKKAARLSGVEPEIMQQDKVRDLINHYLGYYRFDLKYHALQGKLIMLWHVNREILNEVDAEDVLKSLDKMNKLADLQDKLRGSIEKLMSEIYGDVLEIGKEKVKQVLSPEERIKRKKV